MRIFVLRLACAAAFVITVFACTDDAPGTSPGTSGGFGGPDATASSSSSGSSGTSSGGLDGSTSGDPDAPAPEVFVTVTNETMTFGGKTRSYVLAKPSDYDASKSYPLVMSFHGNPGAATGMAQGLPFDSVSKRAAVIVYPQADTNNWDLYTPTDTNADMFFIEALVDEVKNNKANIDKTKVFGFGYSGGGFFLTQFTCRFGGVFKAISVNAGGGPDEEQMGYEQRGNGCYICPGGPVATLVTHGANDAEVEPASGEFTKTCYASTNGCDGSLSASTPAPCQTHDGCPADKPVKWCLIPNLGHGVWGEAMKESWSFFTALP